MHARSLRTKRGLVTIRPLRPGDTSTVSAVFDGLGPESRRLRFGGGKAVLVQGELERLARVDGRRHVLVAYGDGKPVALAQLVRLGAASAEIACVVADEWQRQGIGTALARLLAADAAAAGIVELRAHMHAANRASLSLMRKATRIVAGRLDGSELLVVGLTA